MDEPQDKENAMAGALTGVMLTLLGGAFPALLIWSVVTHWEAVISGSHNMTSVQAMQGIGLLTVSTPILGFGIKMLRVNLLAFWRL